MKAIYKDKEKSPGSGFFIFSGELFPSPPWRISLQRALDHKFLAGGGKWVGESVFLPLDGELKENGSLELAVDPKIVDSLNLLEKYQVTLKGSEGQDLKARLKVGAITFSREERRDNTARARKEEPRPENLKPAPPAGKVKDKPEPAGEAAPSLEPSDGESLRLPEPERKAKSRSWLWLAFLFIAAVGALLAWILWKNPPDSETGPVSQSAPKPTNQEPKIELPKPIGKGEAPKSAGQLVKEFFSQPEPAPHAALNLAAALPKASAEEQDAIYRLYYFAYENGDQEAAMSYGNCLNPALPQWGTIKKNAPDAMQAYEKAENLNPEAAQKARADLLAWLEDQAAKGDAQAERWLNEIKK